MGKVDFSQHVHTAKSRRINQKKMCLSYTGWFSVNTLVLFLSWNFCIFPFAPNVAILLLNLHTHTYSNIPHLLPPPQKKENMHYFWKFAKYSFKTWKIVVSCHWWRKWTLYRCIYGHRTATQLHRSIVCRFHGNFIGQCDHLCPNEQGSSSWCFGESVVEIFP